MRRGGRETYTFLLKLKVGILGLREPLFEIALELLPGHAIVDSILVLVELILGRLFLALLRKGLGHAATQ
jgi:hypothetical protein